MTTITQPGLTADFLYNVKDILADMLYETLPDAARRWNAINREITSSFYSLEMQAQAGRSAQATADDMRLQVINSYNMNR